ncbi:MAG: endonuclease/exonuclease/phosphatase family protein [Candidatus Heimdallarchaeota archaeon]|nr:endonuclease/exonuclease/phosphatase family protein [Candidatus Heimdallarchaeota archaeon]MCK4876693.1 endonuclease/exonuclease/phosphatase family protein [Candidatus Heimdallarchaeota archaeon]
MKKKIIITLAITLAVVITVPVLITHFVQRDETIIKDFYPRYYDILSGTVKLELTMSFDSVNASFSIYFDDELVSSSNSYDLDTTLYDDGPYEIVFKAKEKGKKTAVETVNVVIDNFIDSPPTDAFKVMAYNIWESGREVKGFNGGIRPQDGWLDVMKEENADIAILVETGSLDNGDNAQLIRAMKILSGYYYMEAPYDGCTEQDIPSVTDGEAVISRYPILEFHQIKDYRLDDGTMFHYHHDFCDAVIDINGLETHVIGYHGKCCNNTGDEPTMRRNETEGIINYLDDLGDVPIIWGGDFNAFSPVDTADPELVPMGNLGDGPLTMILNPEDPTWGQYSSKVHNFTDTYRTLNPNKKGCSFGYWEPQYWGRIDYIIVNQWWADKLINATAGDTPSANKSSDHYSVDCFFSLDEDYSCNCKQVIKEQKSTIQANSKEFGKQIYLAIVLKPKKVSVV